MRTVFTILGVVVGSQGAFAAVYDFETANQFSDSFHTLASVNSPTTAQTSNGAANDYLRMAQRPSGNFQVTSAFAYNTSATKTLANSDTFGGAFTVDFKVSSNTPGGSGFGLFLFDPTSSNGSNNLYAWVQFNQSSENDRIRIARDASPTSTGNGTTYTTGLTGTNAGFLDASGYHQVNAFSSTSNSSPVFTNGSITYTPGTGDTTTLAFTLGAATVTAVIPDTDVISNPAIAFRLNTYGNGTAEWRLDDIAFPNAVPEPASMGLLALAGTALLARRRHV